MRRRGALERRLHAGGTGATAGRLGGIGRGQRQLGLAALIVVGILVEVVTVLTQTASDDLEGEKVLPLLAQDPPQPFDVVLIELAVSRGGPLGIDETLAFEEPDLGDGDVRELLPKEGKDLADREV